MLNIKKMVLFLIVGVFLFGMANIVFGGVFPNTVGFHANITGISRDSTDINNLGEVYKVTATTKNALTETNANTFDVEGDDVSIAYLRNTTVGITNGWLINITIFHFNISKDFNNVTRVNISLPAGLNASSTTNKVCIGNASDVSGLNCSVYGSGRDIVWHFDSDDVQAVIMNGSLTGNNTKISNGVGNVTFTINVTSAPSVDGLIDIRVRVSNDSIGTYATVGGAATETEFNISDKIYLDGTKPTFDSAVTNDTTHVNVTFSENMNLTTLETISFNITFTNTSALAERVDISAVETVATHAAAANNTEFTLTIGGIEANETPVIILNMSEITEITDLAGYAIADNTSITATDGTSPTIKEAILDFNLTVGANLTLIFDEPINTTIITNVPSAQILIRGGKANGTVVNISTNTVSFKDGDTTLANTTVIELSMTDAAALLNATNTAGVEARPTPLEEANSLNTPYNISLVNATFFIDNSGNPIRMNTLLDSNGNYYNISRYVNDTIVPTVSNFTYKHVSVANAESILTIGFTEPIAITAITMAKIVLSNSTNTQAQAGAANGTDNQDVIILASLLKKNHTHISKSIAFNITSAERDKIAEWNRSGVSQLYLYTLDNATFYDMAGNPVDGINNQTDRLTSTTWTDDKVAPYILSMTMNDVNITAAGIIEFNFTFSENMTNSSYVIELRNERGTGGTKITTFGNVSLGYGTPILRFNKTMTTDTSAFPNGEWTIRVLQAYDLSGNNISGNASDLSATGLNESNDWQGDSYYFSFDSVNPQLIYAYYLNNGTVITSAAYDAFNGTKNENDTLILMFNEVLRDITVGNISLTNFSWYDYHSGEFGKDNVTIEASGHKVTLRPVQLNHATRGHNTAPTLSLRGESFIEVVNHSLDSKYFEDNRLGWDFVHADDIDTDETYCFIRDKADNCAINTTSSGTTTDWIMIADYAVEIENNTATTISFPVCVNTTAMGNYLPAAARYEFVSYYNTATWTDTAVTALAPLVGYRFTWSDTERYPATDIGYNESGKEIFRVYLKNASSCGPPGPTLTIGDGYNFLAPEGVMTGDLGGYTGQSKGDALTIDAWLGATLSTGQASTTVSDVSFVYHYDNGSSYSEAPSAGKDWDDEYIMIYPYTGWWVYTKGDASTTYGFGGTGRY